MASPLLDLWFAPANDPPDGPLPHGSRPTRRATQPGLAEADDLVARVRTGDSAAFDVLYTDYFTALWTFARRYVGSARAEEVVHDVLLRLWEQRSQWDVRTSVRAYLFGAVRNHALHVAERISVEERAAAALVQDVVETQEADDPAAAELREAVSRALASLPERQRAAMILRLQRSLSYAELGAALGVSATAAGNLVVKGQAKLRILLAPYLVDGVSR